MFVKLVGTNADLMFLLFDIISKELSEMNIEIEALEKEVKEIEERERLEKEVNEFVNDFESLQKKFAAKKFKKIEQGVPVDFNGNVALLEGHIFRMEHAKSVNESLRQTISILEDL